MKDTMIEPTVDSTEFLPDAVELESRRPPPIARATLYVLVAAIAALVAWATFSNIDVVVTAEGRLVTSSDPVVVQALETSLVRSIEVQAGQAVKRGQVVATLDPTFAVADVAQVEQRITSLSVEIARIEAELDGRPYPSSGHPEEDRIQSELYERRVSEYDARLKGFDADLARIEADLAGTQRSHAVIQERLGAVRKIEEMKSRLRDKQFVSEMDLLEARTRRLETEQALEDAANKAKQLAQQIEQTRQAATAFSRSWKQKLLDDLLRARRDRDALQENLNKARRRSALVELHAPIDAVVVEVNKRSVGTVAKEAEMILSLVPQGVALEAEVRVAAEDIGFVRTNNPVRIKLDAYPFQKHGVLSGSVAVLGGDSFPVDRSGSTPRPATRAYYIARIGQIDGELKGLQGDARLMPGMTLTAEIRVSERSVISYFLYPFIKGFSESLHEP